jgi:hypothetical protein
VSQSCLVGAIMVKITIKAKKAFTDTEKYCLANLLKQNSKRISDRHLEYNLNIPLEMAVEMRRMIVQDFRFAVTLEEE